MKKVRLLIILITVLLMCSGFAYANWTEQIQFDFTMRTAQIELEVSNVQTSGVRVDSTVSNQATIHVKEIQPGECATADITFMNTGTIPIDIDNIKVSSVCGYSGKNKEQLELAITASANGKKIIDCSKQINHWKSNAHTGVKALVELPVGETVTIQVKVIMSGNNDVDKEKEDKENNQDVGQIFENVSFILTPEYSRFNED